MRRLYGVVDQGESCWIEGQFSDGENAVARDYILTFLGTLYCKQTKAVINGRAGQNLLNANDSVVTPSGLFRIALQPADNAIVANTPENSTEIHVLRLEWTWNDGAVVRTGREELEFAVRRLAQTV